MNIQEEVDRITRTEIIKQLKPLRPRIEKAIAKYLSSKDFTKALKKGVQEELDEHIFGDGVLSVLPENELDNISRKAIRSVLKI